ncbi:hypothetical protein BCR32DRAFT_297131, partial [Anaeromyces robustus]
MKLSLINNNSRISKDENFDFSKFLSQNSFFPPTPENKRTYRLYSKDDVDNKKCKKNNFSIFNRIEFLKETLIDVISKTEDSSSKNGNLSKDLETFNNNNNSSHINYTNNKFQYTQNSCNNLNDYNNTKNNFNNINDISTSHIINNRNNSYLSYISLNNNNILFQKNNKYHLFNNITEDRNSLLKKSFINSYNDQIERNSKFLTHLSGQNSITEKNSINNSFELDNSSYKNEDEFIDKSHSQSNKTFTNSSLTYDKSTFMSNKTYVNSSFDKSNCNMSTTSYKKVLGEINNILNSRSNILNKKENDDNTNNIDKSLDYISSSSPIHDYQISTMGYKLFPDNFDKTLTSNISNHFNNKKFDSFNYDGFIDEDNDPFNSKLSIINKENQDLFNYELSDIINNEDQNPFNSNSKLNIIDDDADDIDIFNVDEDQINQEPTKCHSTFSENLNFEEDNSNNENNYDEELSNIIEKGCESSFIDFKPYELYMNAFYSKNDIDISNSKDSDHQDKKDERNTILPKDVIGENLSNSSYTLSTSLSSFTDSSLGIKKANLDIQFTEDNQIKAEHIANMTPGTFFGQRSAPLGCLDGESLTPSQRPLYKYFTPQSELQQEYPLSDSDNSEDNSSIHNQDDFINSNTNIFNNINELSIFENKNTENDDIIKPIKIPRKKKQEKAKEKGKKSLKETLSKQKVSHQTLVFLSTVIKQTGFEQQKYFIDFGNVKINTRKCWNIILQCNIVKVINWQLTQEKTILEKKFTKDGNEFIQNH